MLWSTLNRPRRNGGLRLPTRVRTRRCRRYNLERLEDRTLLSDTTPPIVAITRPISRDPDNPDQVEGTAIQILAVATDVTTGNSGILADEFVFEYEEKALGGEFGPWQTFTGFQTQISTYPDQTNVTTLFRGIPYHIYGFRITARDGAGNQAASSVKYAEPTIRDIDVEIVIDPQCSPTLPPSAVRIATDIIDRLSVGDSVGLIVGNDSSGVTFPMTKITPGSTVRADAKAKLLGSFVRYQPAQMTDLLLLAQEQLLGPDPGFRQSIVALTDGVHSRLAPALAQVDSLLEPDTAVYGIGYLREANQGPLLDLVRLRDGAYFFQPDASDMDDLDRQLHAGHSLPVKIDEFQGALSQGKVYEHGFAVGPAQATLMATAQWSAGDLDLQLQGPDGTIYTRDSVQTNPNVQFVGSERYESIRISAPLWGDWQFRLLGGNVPGTAIFTGAVESDSDGQPVYTVLDGPEVVAFGDTLDLGSFVQGTSAPKLSLTVRNDGIEPATLIDIAVPSGFSVVASPTTPILPGASAPVEIEMSTSSVGASSGFVRFLMENQSHRTTVYSFGLTGSVSDGTPDEIGPAQPSSPDLDKASDLGSSNSDDLTSLNTLVFRGRAEATSTVELLEGSSLLGTATVSRAGKWSMIVGPLSDGEHVLATQARDAAGNTSVRSLEMSVTVDTVAPGRAQSPLLDPASDSGASNSDQITSASEPELRGIGEPDGLVELFDGINLIATTFSDSAGFWELGNWALSDGVHDLSVRVKDPACNTSALSVPLRLTIDSIAPATPAMPDLDATRDGGLSSSDNVTNQDKLLFTGLAEANSTVQFLDGATPIASVSASALGAWTVLTGPLASGPHKFAARAADVAGNMSGSSATLSVLIDTDPPLAPTLDLDVTSDLGSSGTDNLTSDNTPTLNGVGERNGQVEVLDAGRSLGRANVNNLGGWTFTTGILSDGVHSLTARAIDQAGNLSGTSPLLSITIDTTPPAPPAAPDMDAASDLGISNTDNVTRDATPTFVGLTTPSSSVQLFEGTRSLGAGVSGPSGTWTITSIGLTNGAHSVTVKVMDPAGNASAPSPSLLVSIDTVAPAISIPDLDDTSDHGISATDNVTNETRPGFHGNTDPLSTVELYVAGSLLASMRADAGGAWHLAALPAAQSFVDGTYAIVTRVIDIAGNVGTVSPPLTVTIDTIAPAAPASPDLDASSDTGPSDSDNVTSDDTPLLVGLADSGAAAQLFDGNTPLGTAIADGSGAWAFTPSPLAKGSHSIFAQITDAAGNAGPRSVPLSITVTNSTVLPPPSTPDLDPSSDGGISSTDDFTGDTTPTLRGVAGPGDTVQIFEGLLLLGSGLANSHGDWSVTTQALGAGSHRLAARASDGAGNTSVLSNELVIQIDTTPPVVERLDLITDNRGNVGQIIVTFSEEVLGGTQDFRLAQTGSRKSASISRATFSGRTATVIPKKAISDRKLSKYQLRLGTGAGLMDAAGNKLDGDLNGVPGGEALLPLVSGAPRRAAIGSYIDSLLEQRELSTAMLLGAK